MSCITAHFITSTSCITLLIILSVLLTAQFTLQIAHGQNASYHSLYHIQAISYFHFLRFVYMNTFY